MRDDRAPGSAAVQDWDGRDLREPRDGLELVERNVPTRIRRVSGLEACQSERRRGHSHLAACSWRFARLDEKVVDEPDLTTLVAAAVIQAEVGELLLLEQVDTRIRWCDDRERVNRRRVELLRSEERGRSVEQGEKSSKGHT